MAVPYPSPPQTADGEPEASETEEESKSEEKGDQEDIAGDDDVSETKENNKSEETEDAEDIESVDDVSETEKDSKGGETDEETDDIESNDRQRLNKTFEIHHCHTVVMNDFKARGIKMKGSGNNASQISCTSCSFFLL